MSEIIKESDKYVIVLFDGPCNLCNKYVDFVVKHDKYDNCRFASLESDIGIEFLQIHNMNTETFDSIIAVSNGEVFIKSRAIFKIVSVLKSPVKFISYFKYVSPQFLNDFFYSMISKYRYSLFGKADSCRIPDESEMNKFI